MRGGADRDDVLVRLRRAEGQVRGVQRMVASDTCCIDVLTQIAATTRALQAVALELLGNHLAQCMSGEVPGGAESADARVKEACAAVARLVRS